MYNEKLKIFLPALLLALLGFALAYQFVDPTPPTRLSIAYAQSGLVGPDSGLESLGSMYFEPLWIFLAPGVDASLLSDMKGLRLHLAMIREQIEKVSFPRG